MSVMAAAGGVSPWMVLSGLVPVVIGAFVALVMLGPNRNKTVGETLGDAIEDLRAELIAARKDRDDARSERDEARGEVSRCRCDAELARQELDRTKNQLENARHENRLVRRNYAALQERMNEMNGETA